MPVDQFLQSKINGMAQERRRKLQLVSKQHSIEAAHS